MYINIERSSNNVVKLIINTNTTYNVMNIKFMTEFLDVLSQIEKEKNYRFIIIKGDKNFGIGADMKELNVATKDREFAVSFFTYMKDIYSRLINMDKIIIGQVEGIASGFHLELLLVMDFVLAKRDAKFAIPEGRIGIFPPVLLTLGPYIIGINNVRRLAMLGEEINAEEAERMGLITKAVDDIDLETQRLITRMSYIAPSSLTLMRRFIAKYLERNLDDVFKSLSLQVTSDEAREGINAYLSKLQPSWLIGIPQSK